MNISNRTNYIRKSKNERGAFRDLAEKAKAKKTIESKRHLELKNEIELIEILKEVLNGFSDITKEKMLKMNEDDKKKMFSTFIVTLGVEVKSRLSMGLRNHIMNGKILGEGINERESKKITSTNIENYLKYDKVVDYINKNYLLLIAYEELTKNNEEKNNGKTFII